MPNMNCIKAIDNIRKKEEKTDKHIPTIGITSYSDEDERDNYIELGMDEYLPKPFLDKNLKDIVSRCLL